MRLVLFRDLHFIFIFIDAIKSVIDFDISMRHCEDLSSYQTIILLLQSERLNQLRLTPLAITVYHTYPTLPLATTYPLSACQNV